MGMPLVTKLVVSYCQGNAVFVIHYMVKFNQLYTNKTERFSCISRRAVRVPKLIKEDWPIVLQ